MLTLELPWMPRLQDGDFRTICEWVRNLAGIQLQEGKRELVRSRLGKRLRHLGLSSYHTYLDYVRRDGSQLELKQMLNALTTNVTGFFRESKHFDYLADVLLPEWIASAQNRHRRLRIWSAGCSTGEEPYSIAMVVLEKIKDAQRWDIKILATDLSSPALEIAHRGQYESEALSAVRPDLRQKYFTGGGSRRHPQPFKVHPILQPWIYFARHNLADAQWPMQGPLDAIFCRNVMIYFDQAVRQNVVEKYWRMLDRSGTLFVGHSESLSVLKQSFTYVAPSIYRKI